MCDINTRFQKHFCVKFEFLNDLDHDRFFSNGCSKIKHFPSLHKADSFGVCFPSTDHSANIVTIEDEDENTFVSRLMRENNNITMRVWLGLAQHSAGKGHPVCTLWEESSNLS